MALGIFLTAVAALVVGLFLIRRSPRDVPKTRAATLQVVLSNQTPPSIEIPEATIRDAVDELARATPGTAVRLWRGSHAGEQAEPDSASESSCVQFRRTAKLDSGIQFTRTAAFCLPEPTEAMVLPAFFQTAQPENGRADGVFRGIGIMRSSGTRATGDRKGHSQNYSLAAAACGVGQGRGWETFAGGDGQEVTTLDHGLAQGMAPACRAADRLQILRCRE